MCGQGKVQDTDAVFRSATKSTHYSSLNRCTLALMTDFTATAATLLSLDPLLTQALMLYYAHGMMGSACPRIPAQASPGGAPQLSMLGLRGL